MKHLFIINPAAGKGKAIKLIPHIKDILGAASKEYFIEVTKGSGDAARIAREYSSRDTYRIYAVGGDGTVNEVLNGMINSGSTLAVIPAGTGNDFLRNICEQGDTISILKRMIKGKEEPIDVGRVNGKYFINVSSIGFDAEVAYNARSYKKLPGMNGTLAYILGIVATVFGYRSQYLQLDIDGRQFDGKMLLVAVANGKYYGGGMIPAPDAKINDGILDVCAIDELNKLKILRFFPRLIKGEHGKLKEVSFHRAGKIRISCDKELSLNVDGEILRVREALFEIAAGAVNVVIPE